MGETSNWVKTCDSQTGNPNVPLQLAGEKIVHNICEMNTENLVMKLKIFDSKFGIFCGIFNLVKS